MCSIKMAQFACAIYECWTLPVASACLTVRSLHIGSILQSGRVRNAVYWSAMEGFQDVLCQVIQSTSCASTYMAVMLYLFMLLRIRLPHAKHVERLCKQNGKARLRRHHAVCLPRSRISEQIKSVRCWHTSHLLSPLSYRFLYVEQLANHLLHQL